MFLIIFGRFERLIPLLTLSRKGGAKRGQNPENAGAETLSKGLAARRFFSLRGSRRNEVPRQGKLFARRFQDQASRISSI